MGHVAMVGNAGGPGCEDAGRAWPGGKARRAGIVLALGLVLVVGVARAADGGNAVSGLDYARVRHIEEGTAATASGPGAADDVRVNQPVPPGDRLDLRALRVEIELADSSLIWVDRGSVVEFRSLADRRNRHEHANRLALRRGRVRIDMANPAWPDTVFSIDTDGGSIYLLSAGSFRIEAIAGVTSVTSWAGVAEFSGNAGSVLVRSGESSALPLGGAPSAPRRFNGARRDALDRYHDGRLTAYTEPGGPESAFGEVPTGLPDEAKADARELSFYGTWHTVPPYGTVWTPHSPAGWGPFVRGSWRWYAAGWVWISAEPWGWTPYRYGRWDHAPALGWFWIPGTVWSGAWVAFAVGPAQIGWCPLNYLNQPAFRDAPGGAPAIVSGSLLDPRGWRFVPIEQFGAPPGEPAGVTATAPAQRPDATADLLLTRMLPHFDPVAAARRSDGTPTLPELVRRTMVPLGAPAQDGPGVPFHVEETRTPAEAPPPAGDSAQPDR